MKSNALGNEGNPARLLIKVTQETLPQVKEKYPFLYLEKGRMEIDDSSIKWIDCDCNVVRLPVAMLNCILLGPGTTVTHEAVKVMAAANCGICWVGDDSLIPTVFPTPMGAFPCNTWAGWTRWTVWTEETTGWGCSFT